MDDLIKLATGGISSTSAMGEGVTEGTSITNPSHYSAICCCEEVKAIDTQNI
jgi:hypothetical protein